MKPRCKSVAPMLIQRWSSAGSSLLSPLPACAVFVRAQFGDVRAALLGQGFALVHQCDFFLAQLAVADDLRLGEGFHFQSS